MRHIDENEDFQRAKKKISDFGQKLFECKSAHARVNICAPFYETEGEREREREREKKDKGIKKEEGWWSLRPMN